MKCITHDIDCHGRPVQVLPLADIHVGDRESDDKIITAAIEWLKADVNRYCILGGDLMNTAIKTSISDTYSEKLSPRDQLARVYDLFYPVRERILTIIPGNHEERISKLVGISTDQLLAQEMGIAHLYSDTSAVLFLKFGKGPKGRPLVYTIYCNHGSGGGRKAGSKINRLQDYASIVDADIFVVGHTHFPATFKTGTYRITPQNCTATYREQVFVNTASALSYGGYGDRQGFQPASNSYPVITLNNKEHKVQVTL